jgi:hypothetical protein
MDSDFDDECECEHEYKELQLIPASGWRTCFWDTKNKKVTTRPLVCFALINVVDQKDRFVAAFAPSIEDRQQIAPAGSVDDENRYIWLGYIGVGETVEDLISELKENGEFPDEL